MGFEPTTASLEGWNSTTELRPHYIYNRLILIARKVFSPKQEKFGTSILYMLYIQPAGHGGQARVRTLEADGSRFTVCPR
jgi:hypothetical protein